MIPALAEVERNIKNAADRSLTVRLVCITLGATLRFAPQTSHTPGTLYAILPRRL